MNYGIESPLVNAVWYVTERMRSSIQVAQYLKLIILPETWRLIGDCFLSALVQEPKPVGVLVFSMQSLLDGESQFW